MHLARTLPALQQAVHELRHAGNQIAFVPTMGALHEGHQSLVRAAIAQDYAVVTSVFVNPTQFGPSEDLARYPRDEKGDIAILKRTGCSIAWLPDVDTMYPPGDATGFVMGGPALGWEGARRPGHFNGVAQVVAKLFGQVRPDAAFFGEKDWQQLQVIRRLTADLLLPVAIHGVPTQREEDGLAMSSRNRFLSPEQRAIAPLLFRTLLQAGHALSSSPDAEEICKNAIAALNGQGFDVDYFALIEGSSLSSIAILPEGDDWRLITAARLGSVRLLDNLGRAELARFRA
ncbi:Pantoate--beta-alanine ligase [Granulibacter bethesdensis]|uniref:Pantothenate synthetase n=1 Tax=Granulibacter bethesdensis TaxID=364410 RepID=A0AAN0RD45_9PROT|nr:pantoate--beta-alanine ligase [Granulibacter bethesdensis]AHJ62577.1 Pantoate--beta-alanine ligase [Granulibacter bethesdensis]